MKYISKGMVIRASTEDLLFVTRCGVDFQLTGEQAALWLNGRFGFAKNRENVLEVKALQQLKRQGLVEITEGDEPVFEYRALTQCVLTPAKPQGVRAILSARQKELLLWLTEAGLRLTTAELVFLTEHHVAPQINLLGDRNRQNLTETIYTQETIFDNILEAQMEHAAAAKTDYNEMWSRAGKPFIDGGVSVVGGQPLSVSFRPALFRLLWVQCITTVV